MRNNMCNEMQCNSVMKWWDEQINYTPIYGTLTAAGIPVQYAHVIMALPNGRKSRIRINYTQAGQSSTRRTIRSNTIYGHIIVELTVSVSGYGCMTVKDIRGAGAIGQNHQRIIFIQ